MTLALLLEASLRALAIAAVVGCALAAFKLRNPHAQLAAWRAVLFAALLMPFLMQAVIVTLPALEAPVTVSTPVVEEVLVTGAVPSADTQYDGALEDAENGAVFNVPDVSSNFDWHMIALGVYAAVALALMLRLIVGAALTWRLLRRARRVTADWARGSDVRTSAALSAPVTVGSTILLPPDYGMWSAEKRAAVLSHERAHVARGDFYVLLLAAVYRAAFWFNPLSWWLYDRLAELAELASDAEAVASDDQRPSYAAILLEFAATPRAAFMAVAMARPNTIRRRIEHILKEDAMPARVTRLMQTVIAVAVIPVALAAAVSLVREPAVAAPSSVAEMPLPPPIAERSAVEPVGPLLIFPETPAAPDTPAAPALPSPPSGLSEKTVERMRNLQERSVERVQQRAERDLERAQTITRRTVAQALERANAEMKMAALAEGAAREKEAQTGPVRELPAFKSVSFSSVGSLRITIGAQQSVRVEGDPETVAAVNTRVRGDTLRIDMRHNSARQTDRSLVVHVTVPRLEDVKFSGSGLLSMVGLNGGKLDVDFSGSGTIEANGNLDELDLDISGSGKANMPNLVVAEAELDMSGSAEITVQALVRLDVDISGSGTVTYIGRPKHMSTDVSGSGTFHQRDAI